MTGGGVGVGMAGAAVMKAAGLVRRMAQAQLASA